MKMTLISTVTTWMCATGVAIVAAYTIATCHQDTPQAQKHAAKVAERIAKKGTIPEFKADKHSSAVKKTTQAEVTKVVERPVYVENPLYSSFTNIHARIMAEEEAVIPEKYRVVEIGGIAIGDVIDDFEACVSRKGVDGYIHERIDEITLEKHRRLGDPEFYCTDATYTLLPSTKQVVAIKMHGNLIVEWDRDAQKMSKEITKWMKEDFGATEERVTDTLDFLVHKKYDIGSDLSVEVKAVRLKEKTSEGCNARIDISFVMNELTKDVVAEGQKLAEETDAERNRIMASTAVNYYTVRPKVCEKAVLSGTVY